MQPVVMTSGTSDLQHSDVSSPLSRSSQGVALAPSVTEWARVWAAEINYAAAAAHAAKH